MMFLLAPGGNNFLTLFEGIGLCPYSLDEESSIPRFDGSYDPFLGFYSGTFIVTSVFLVGGAKSLFMVTIGEGENSSPTDDSFYISGS